MTEVKKYSIEQFMDTEAIVGTSISYDHQKILYSSDRTGIFNAFSLSVTGGEAKQLTGSEKDSIYVISYFPEDNRFLYRSDQGGNEIHHIYLRDENGKTKDLTPTKGERAEFYGWSRDGKSFFYGSNKRDSKLMDIYEMNIKEFEAKLLFKNNEAYIFGAISPDKNYIALSKNDSPNDSNIFLYDLKKDKTRLLTPHEGDVQYQPQAFDLNSNTLFYLTDKNEEFLYLKKISLEDKQIELVHKEEWDIANTIFSYQQNYLIYQINNDANIEMKIFSFEEEKFINFPDLSEGMISDISISRDEKIISFLVDSSVSSSNLYFYNLEERKLSKLTDTLNSELNPDHLSKAEVIRFKSFDQLEIPSIFYKPHVKEGEKVPALIWVHGGPGGQSRIRYRPMIQYLVNHGYAVLAVNNRGSSGYGKSFFKAADRKHGEVDLADIVKAKPFLQEKEYIDENKIGIIGNSYGGYMVLAALAFQPEEFDIGIDIFGVSNWVRTLKEIPSWWEAMRNVLYEKIGYPFEDEDYLKSISPLFHAEKITKPLIVLQGANDPRVLKVESDEIVEKAKENGIPVEYIVFDDEGHGFSKKKNRIDGYKAILKFTDKYLKNN
jgi:dipeptidyl aminopeptidase/acylaminoacyl peptidase